MCEIFHVGQLVDDREWERGIVPQDIRESDTSDIVEAKLKIHLLGMAVIL
jgi:hypothetical protein